MRVSPSPWRSAALPAPAWAWSESFDGGFHNTWTFGFVDDVGDPPASGSQSAAVVDDILLISDTVAAETDGGGGSATGFGFVDETFGTTFVRGTVNAGSSPSPVNQLGLLARGDASNGAAYLFGIDFDSGALLLARSDSFTGDPELLLASGDLGRFGSGQSYWLELDAVGSQITGRAYGCGWDPAGRALGDRCHVFRRRRRRDRARLRRRRRPA